jgi:hypothetical protein
VSACRSCGAAIVWATTENGKPIPLDREPIRGLFHLDRRPGETFAIGAAPPAYVSHFATCPNADAHRKRPT